MKCIVDGCQSKTTPGISFFPFPKDPTLRVRWLKAIDKNEESLRPTTRICSVHFPSGQIMNLGGNKYLVFTAIPKLNVPSSGRNDPMIISVPKDSPINSSVKEKIMSSTDNEFTTIYEYIKKLRECSEFLTKSADNVERDTKNASASLQSSTCYEKERNEKCDRIRKFMNEICGEVKQKVHNIERILRDGCSLDKERGNSVGSLTSDHLPSRSQNGPAKPVNETCESNPRSAQAANEPGSGTSNSEDSQSKIRLVAIEKLMDPNVMVSLSYHDMISRELTPPPPFAVTNVDSSSVIILDSDDEVPEPTSCTENTGEEIAAVTTVTNELAEQVLPECKALKVRILKCKILEELVNAGKWKIRLSKYLSKTGYIKDGSDRNCVDSLSSDEDSKKKVPSDDDSDYVPRSRRTNYGLRRRRKTKNSDTQRRYETRYTSSELNSSVTHMRQLRRKINIKSYVESENEQSSETNDEDSEEAESHIENAVKKSGKHKRRNGSVESSSSSDEALINIKHKIDGDVGLQEGHARELGNIEAAEPSKENTVEKSNGHKRANAAAESSSSSDEALIYIKRKTVGDGKLEKGDLPLNSNEAAVSNKEKTVQTTDKRNGDKAPVETSSSSSEALIYIKRKTISQIHAETSITNIDEGIDKSKRYSKRRRTRFK